MIQGCNFVIFFRGHVGTCTKNFRSPQENLRANNAIRFIEEKYKRNGAKHDVNVHGFFCRVATMLILLLFQQDSSSLYTLTIQLEVVTITAYDNLYDCLSALRSIRWDIYPQN